MSFNEAKKSKAYLSIFLQSIASGFADGNST